MRPPAIAQLHDRTRGRDGLQSPQSIEQDHPLLGDMKGSPEGMAKRIAQVDRPGRPHLLRHLLEEADSDGRNPLRLNRPLDQADGLIAQASGRSEEHSVHAVTRQASSHSGRGVLHQGP